MSVGVNPCPICGGEAYAGPLSSFSFGVRCPACRLDLSEELPLSFPEDAPEEADMEWLYGIVQQKAIERWNKIPQP